MKLSFPEDEGIFGIDHDGEKRWYCWRLPHGCRGKLARFAATWKDAGYPYLLSARSSWSLVLIDNQFHFETGAWRLNRRGKSRSKNDSLQRQQLKTWLETAQRLSERVEQGGAQPSQLEMYGEKTMQHFCAKIESFYMFLHDLQPHLLSSKGNFGNNALPAKIECPACGAMNRIPAAHGAIKVRDGKYLKPDLREK
jgi:hypothetical protein